MSLQILLQQPPDCRNLAVGNCRSVANREVGLAGAENPGNLIGQARRGLLPWAGRCVWRLRRQATKPTHHHRNQPDQLHSIQLSLFVSLARIISFHAWLAR
jgi:hypothetical protein